MIGVTNEEGGTGPGDSPLTATGMRRSHSHGSAATLGHTGMPLPANLVRRLSRATSVGIEPAALSPIKEAFVPGAKDPMLSPLMPLDVHTDDDAVGETDTWSGGNQSDGTTLDMMDMLHPDILGKPYVSGGEDEGAGRSAQGQADRFGNLLAGLEGLDDGSSQYAPSESSTHPPLEHRSISSILLGDLNDDLPSQREDSQATASDANSDTYSSHEEQRFNHQPHNQHPQYYPNNTMQPPVPVHNQHMQPPMLMPMVPQHMPQMQNGTMLMQYPGMYPYATNGNGTMQNPNLMPMYPNYIMPSGVPMPQPINTDIKMLNVPETNPSYNVISPSPRSAAAPYTILTPRRAQSPALRLQMGPMQARAQSPNGVYPKSPTSPMSPHSPASLVSPISPIGSQFADPARNFIYNAPGANPQYLQAQPNYSHQQTINPHLLNPPTIAGRMKAGRHSTSSLNTIRGSSLPRSASARVGDGAGGMVNIDTLIKEQESLKATLARSAVDRLKENDESEKLLETLSTLTQMRLLQQ
ncbi:hypothetical protein HK097_000342 [Rhizophlyctis rosea]|uniref:Uncharacterized protein n=1 Tax=Rhizophlyctis rosea TaxID=64517 RepID=A0AAD5SHF5_9FUNG|nr:hypothetical protein HK097_000342 [Rhizophlyctis rosea]